MSARIIAVAEAYDRYTNKFSKVEYTKLEAINEKLKEKSIKYDPHIVDALIGMLN